MAVTSNPAARDVLNQLIHDPAYADIADIPLISLRQIGLTILPWLGLTISVIGYLQGWFGLFVAWCISVPCIFAGFTPLHDGTHRSVSRNRVINDVLGVIAGTPLFPGINMPAYRALHLDHHRHTGDPVKDPDEGFVAFSKGWKLFLLAFGDLMWLRWYFSHARHHWPARHVFWFWAAFAGMSIVYLVGLTSPWGYEFLVLFLIPQRLAMLVLGYSFAHIQHPEGLAADDYPFQATVRIKGNLLVRSFLIGQNHHDMHHLMPHIPWYRYHKVRDLANGVLNDQNIPIRGFFTPVKEITLPPSQNHDGIDVTITDIQQVAQDVRSYRFASQTGEPLPAFTAGSHITLYLPNGLRRQYSLLNDPSETGFYEIAVKRDINGRGGSMAVHDNLTVGQPLHISTPRNNFVLYEDYDHYILVGGGIGMTPLLSMAWRLHRLGKSFAMHVFARRKADIAFGINFGNDLQNLPFARSITLHLDDQDKTRAYDQILAQPGPRHMLYICGPGGFMDRVSESAMALGWQDRAIRRENFTAYPDHDKDNRSFAVTLAQTGKTLHVGESETLLDVLLANKMDVPYACMQGTCGTCLIPIQSGKADHRDAYLGDKEKTAQTRLCACVSRAAGPEITLDF